MTPEERIQHQGNIGGLNVILAMVYALIDTHPDKQALHRAFATHYEALIALQIGDATEEATISATRLLGERLAQHLMRN